MEDAFFNYFTTSFKISYTRNSQHIFGFVKDTPLIFVVGFLELAGMVNLAKTNPKWLGMAMEGYVFAGLVFWVICYAMSRYSQNLEKKLSTERH